MGATDQKTLLKIRTFASDMKRAQGIEDAPGAEIKPTPKEEKVDLPKEKKPEPVKEKHFVVVEKKETEKKPATRLVETKEPNREIKAAPAAPKKIPAFHELQKSTPKTHAHTAHSTPKVRRRTPHRKRDHSFTSTTTIITDNKHAGGNFLEQIVTSLTGWFTSLKKSFAKKKTPRYTIQDSERRKGVIQKATTKTGALFTADNETLREEIRRRRAKQKEIDELDVSWSPNTDAGYVLLEAPEDVQPPVRNVQVTFKKKATPLVASSEAVPTELPQSRTADPEKLPKPSPDKKATKEEPSIPPVTIINPSESEDLLAQAAAEPVTPAPEESAAPKPTDPDEARWAESADIPEEVPVAPEPAQNPAQRAQVNMVDSGMSFITGKTKLHDTDTNALTLGAAAVIASLVVVVITGRIIFGIVTQSETPTAAVTITPVIEKATVIDVPVSALSKNTLEQAANQSDAMVPNNFTEVSFVDPAGTAISPVLLLDTLELSVNSNFIQTVSKAHLVVIDKTRHALVFEVADSTTALGSLLAWEEAIPVELGGLLNISMVPNDAVFIDRVIYERDVRILVGESGEVLAYGFIEDDVILITNGTDAFSRVLIEKF